MCTEVPLGTTEIRLILQSLYLYYKVYTCSKVLVGTIGLKFTLVQRYP